jgi:hypothetical protein
MSLGSNTSAQSSPNFPKPINPIFFIL